MKSNVQETLTAWLKGLCVPSNECQLIVAFSGGRDSHVLLHALQSLRANIPALTLRVIHVNHGLQPLSAAWAKHCEQTAVSYGLVCQTINLQLAPQKGQSIEEEARNGRYLAFKSVLEPNELLLTAHTEDDQAETLMLQLMRGAGPKGLSAMVPCMPLGQGLLARPLLGVSRQDIADYAAYHQLCWVEDPSNQDTRFARNFLRRNVFMSLRTYYPGFTRCMARSAGHIADSEQLLAEYLKVDFSACLDQDGMLDLLALKNFSDRKQMAILREWLRHHQIRSPTTLTLKSILQQTLTAKIDAKVTISFGNVTLYRYQQKLYWQQKALAKAPEEVAWDLRLPLVWAGKSWRAKKVKGQGIYLGNESQNILMVRARQGGEKCRLQGEKITRSLKKVLQKQQVPFWQRRQLPLFYRGHELVSLGGALICEGWQVNAPEEIGWVIEAID